MLGVEQPLNTSLQSYTYDANGNRTSKNGTAYQIATTSNRLLQTGSDAFSYDAMGNTTAMPNAVGDSLTLTYGAHQRLVNLSNSNGASGEYTYNGHGERVKKLFRASPTDPQSAIVFLYDDSGQLQGEYDVNGVPISQYLWLGNQVLGLIRSGAVYAIHVDHLTTPRAVVDGNGTALWRWDSEAMPFGETLANLDPDGDSVEFDLKLRFPGQYYDQEAGLHHNYLRDYDPSTSRYIESDLIGILEDYSDLQLQVSLLQSLPLATNDPLALNHLYGYANQSPLIFTDAFGLNPRGGERGATGGSSGQNSNNPYKHCRQHPTMPNKIQCKHHQTGKWIEKPKPADWPEDNAGEGDCPDNSNCQKVATAVVVGGTAYIVYRCVRLIPSLLPPLWPTIPANVAIP